MSNKIVSAVSEDQNSSSNGSSSSSSAVAQKILRRTALFAAVALGCYVLYASIGPYQFLPASFYPFTPSNSSSLLENEDELEGVLRNATMKDKTVIMTTLNDAWAEPNSIFDLFIKSFKVGKNTEGLLKHLVVICLDDKAYSRCIASHPHCYQLRTKGANFTNEAFFMSPHYLEMMWRRIEFLGFVLELGYNFVFTDTDIMWLRDPFKRFLKEGDFQIACDYYKGNPYDRHNNPNGGFTYVKSNRRSIEFYKFWYHSRWAHPGLHDQDVLNKIKFDPFIDRIGLKMAFLDTAYIGGFCQPLRNLDVVCTMHANCCVGLRNKINDLTMLLDDWRRYINTTSQQQQQSTLNSSTTTTTTTTTHTHVSWSVPLNCSTSFRH
ncbi:uncharacterized protein At4g15970-like [Humulus lupulus]|uniref:uncharacterized protein At4g15970-like n=1 Tax=Humulus lupulus TaxID=3486 RepID=UPI002B407C62|nr:uncharacterized protein At4g15970-like [Humulus lupulus]